MKHTHLISICFCFGILNANADSLQIQKGTDQKVKKVVFPNGDSIEYDRSDTEKGIKKTYSFKIDSFRETEKPLKLSFFSSEDSFDGWPVVQQHLRPALKSMKSLQQVIEQHTTDPKARYEAAKMIWVNQKYNTELATDATQLDRQSYYQQIAPVKFKELIASKGLNINDPKQCFPALMLEVEQLYDESVKAREQKALQYESASAHPKIASHLTQTIDTIASCNQRIASEIRKLSKNENFRLQPKVTKALNELNQNGSLSLSVSEDIMMVPGKYESDIVWLNMPYIIDVFQFEKHSGGVFGKNLSTHDANVSFKNNYFGQGDFSLKTIGGENFNWKAFWLLHEFGHIIQKRYVQKAAKYEFNAAIADRIENDSIVLEKTLKEKIVQTISKPYRKAKESSATYFAIDIMAASCM